MAKKQKSKTVSTYKKYKAAKYALFGGVVACPTVPATIVTLINWEEWFNKSSISLPFGFSMLLVTVIVAIVGVLNSDTVFKKADVALYYLAGIFMCIGLTCMFLASLFSQMGYLWLYTASGLLGSGVCSTAEKKVIQPKIDFYRKLIDENGLDRRSRRMQESIQIAKEEAKVRF